MSNRPTPETDAAKLNHSYGVVDIDFARKLERERYEAREMVQQLCKPPEHGLNSLLNDAIDCVTDADICSGMGMAAHSLGYLQLAMGKLAQAETQLKGNTR